MNLLNIIPLYILGLWGQTTLVSSAPPPSQRPAFISEVLREKIAPTPEGPNTVDTYWLTKTVRLFRGGRGFRTGEDWEALTRLSHEEVVDVLMTSPQFGDLILDFNLYFLGFKSDSIFAPNFPSGSVTPYQAHVFSKPQAIVAAREVLHHGDYFKLFDLKVPRLIMPVQGALDPKDLPQEDRTGFPDMGTETAKMTFTLDVLSKYLGNLVLNWEMLLKGEQTLEAACTLLTQPLNRAYRVIRAANLPDEIAAIFYDGFSALEASCDPLLKMTPSSFQVSELRRLVDLKPYILEHFEEWTAPLYRVSHVGEFKVFEHPDLTKATTNSLTIPGFWEHFLNSSTNENRRRAASILRTYFCDDLTPINLPTGSPPDSHSENRHASDPGCRSCHYKLDPMAGFFRDYGLLGLAFKDSDSLVFDDMGRVYGHERLEYLQQWKAPESSPRIWNVGYIRQPFRENRNDYGESLEDLFTIVRKAPEVKSCLVRRLAEYMLGTDQTFDQLWLDQLSDQFSREQNSSVALRNIIKSLALSQTYRQRDPDPNTCYDEVKSPISSGIPCEIRGPFQKHCVSCHNNAEEDHGLDLTQWIPLDTVDKSQGGKTPADKTVYGFVHLDAHGVQRSLGDSFTRIKARLEGRDPDRPDSGPGSSPSLLMPPGGGRLSSPEKQRIFRWIDQTLQRESQP